MGHPIRGGSLVLLAVLLAACGGSGSSEDSEATRTAERIAHGGALAARVAQTHPACEAIRPFYWEVGDTRGVLAGGSVGSGAPGATTAMPIASASKWVWSAYVVQRRGGVLSEADVRFLTFRSGYHSMGALSCDDAPTVDACLDTGSNGRYTRLHDGKFFYNGGHMQRQAHELGLGAYGPAALTAEVSGKIGQFGFVYTAPQPPGGLIASATQYGAFLRRLLDGSLLLGRRLGDEAVCTNPLTCADAIDTPVPPSLSWHYALGHWVEDDPQVGDSAFSSPGAFGFYPWIDPWTRSYGVIARQRFSGEQEGFASAQCGYQIRRAWRSGGALS